VTTAGRYMTIWSKDVADMEHQEPGGIRASRNAASATLTCQRSLAFLKEHLA